MNETIMDGVWIINVGHEVGKSNPLYVILCVLLGIFAAIIIFGIICEMLEDMFDIDTSDSWISILCVLLITFGGIAGGWTGAISSETLISSRPVSSAKTLTSSSVFGASSTAICLRYFFFKTRRLVFFLPDSSSSFASSSAINSSSEICGTIICSASTSAGVSAVSDSC